MPDICRGRKPVIDLLTKSPEKCAKLFIANNVRPPFLDDLLEAAKNSGVIYQIVDPRALDKLSEGDKHQGVICTLNPVKQIDLDEFLKNIPEGPALIVVLDHLEDPHNLGAVIRSAEAGGALCVIHAKRRAAIPNDTVIKTSAGAALRLPVIQVVNITRTLEALKAKNFWTIGLDSEAKDSIWNDTLPERTALVIGAEGFGLSRLVSESCDMLMKIPIKKDSAGSLNASVAAALGIFEWSRNYASC